MVNDRDNHTATEYYCDNYVGLGSYPSCFTCPSYLCENDHKSITNFLTLSKKKEITVTHEYCSRIKKHTDTKNVHVDFNQ